MVFNGLEILFFTLGVLTTLGVIGLVYYNRSFTIKWYSWILAVLGLLLLVFSIAWFFSGIMEGVAQAGALGLVFFGIPALLLLFITRRLVLKDSQ